MPPGVQFMRQLHRIDDEVPVDEVSVGRRPHCHLLARGGFDGGPRDLQFLFRRQLEKVIGDVVVPRNFGRSAEDAPRHRTAQTHLLDGPGHPDRRLEVRGGIVIVDHGGRAGPGSLEGRQPDPGPRLLPADHLCVRPHEVAQPGIERHPLAQAPPEALEHVRMGIDEPGEDCFAGTIDHSGSAVLIKIFRRTYGKDPVCR